MGFDINDLSVVDAEQYLSGVYDPAELARLEEQNVSGKNRKGVQAAVQARRAELDADEDFAAGDEPDGEDPNAGGDGTLTEGVASESGSSDTPGVSSVAAAPDVRPDQEPPEEHAEQKAAEKAADDAAERERQRSARTVKYVNSDGDQVTVDGMTVYDTIARSPQANAGLGDFDEARAAAEEVLPGGDSVEGDGPGPVGEPGPVRLVDLPDRATGGVFDWDGPNWDVDASEGDTEGVFRYAFTVHKSHPRNAVLVRSQVMTAAIQAGYQSKSSQLTLLATQPARNAHYERRIYGMPVVLRDYQPVAEEPAPSNPTGQSRTDAPIEERRDDSDVHL